MGQLVKEKSNATGSISFSYDSSGNCLSKVIANMQGDVIKNISYVYSSDNRLLRKLSLPEGDICDYNYNRNYQLSLRVCGSESTKFTWNALGRLVQVQKSSVHATTKVFKYTYDSLGRRISVQDSQQVNKVLHSFFLV